MLEEYEEYNVLLTAIKGEELNLLRQLEALNLGVFKSTDFKDVILGRVEDVEAFLKRIEEETIFGLARAMYIETWIAFKPDNFEEEVFKAIKDRLQNIKEGESFCVRISRRGLKGKLNSQQAERKLGSLIWKEIEARGRGRGSGIKPKVDLKEPDWLINIETLANKAGVSMVSKARRKAHFYLRSG
jgi:tRNA(Ser,Leu) C12 N-acetylase TAN1